MVQGQIRRPKAYIYTHTTRNSDGGDGQLKIIFALQLQTIRLAILRIRLFIRNLCYYYLWLSVSTCDRYCLIAIERWQQQQQRKFNNQRQWVCERRRRKKKTHCQIDEELKLREKKEVKNVKKKNSRYKGTIASSMVVIGCAYIYQWHKLRIFTTVNFFFVLSEQSKWRRKNTPPHKQTSRQIERERGREWKCTEDSVFILATIGVSAPFLYSLTKLHSYILFFFILFTLSIYLWHTISIARTYPSYRSIQLFSSVSQVPSFSLFRLFWSPTIFFCWPDPLHALTQTYTLCSSLSLRAVQLLLIIIMRMMMNTLVLKGSEMRLMHALFLSSFFLCRCTILFSLSCVVLPGLKRFYHRLWLFYMRFMFIA